MVEDSAESLPKDSPTLNGDDGGDDASAAPVAENKSAADVVTVETAEK